MRRLIGLCLVLALAVTLAAPAFAQGDAPKTLRLSGTIVLVSQDKSSFTIQRDNTKLPITFDSKTQFTTRNKPGSSAQDLQEGRRVVVLVLADSKDRLATRVDFRTDKR
jgi:hypothetical protein